MTNLFDEFKKWRLVRYKKKKVRQEKTRRNRTYWLKFSIKILDPINPQDTQKDFEMMVPARAAFFAKIKARKVIMEKIDLYFSDCKLVSDEELEYHEKSKEIYIKQIENRKA